MKKITISLGIILCVAAVVAVAGTYAFLSDTETSAGNSFIAGAIDLKIDSTCHYDGMICAKNQAGAYVWQEEVPGQSSTYPELLGQTCTCSWDVADWVDGTALFSFADIKPGDKGEDTISLHVDSNPAWICAEITDVVQNDNGCNSPELKAEEAAYGTGNATCGSGEAGIDQGELWANLKFSFWKDNGAGDGHTCNNIKDEDETYIQENINAINLQYAIADSQNGGQPITDTCIGVSWDVPANVNNIAQTDSVTGNVTFKAYQARHNDNFVCYAQCGNGKQEPGEACDDGAENGAVCTPEYNSTCSYCSTECTVVTLTDGYCGDGVLETQYEQCDDGNTDPGDGCSATCQIESGELIVYKIVVGGTAIPDDFTINVAGANPSSFHGNSNGTGTYVPVGGAYVVTENPVPSDYTVSYTGDCDSVMTVGGKSCTVTNTFKTGNLKVVKVVANPGQLAGVHAEGEFQMTINGGNVNQDQYYPVPVGDNTVGETDSYGYDVSYSDNCPGGVVNVPEGEDVTCTITNTVPYITVTVTKLVENQPWNGNNIVANFPLFVGSNSVTSGVPKNIAPGTYLVSESSVNGYYGTYAGDCNPSTHLMGGSGGSFNCTLTNTALPAQITLIKVVDGPGLPTDFIMRVDGTPVSTEGSILVTANAAHIISEDPVAGYTSTVSGHAKCPAALDLGTANLNEGESITCTITNTYTPQ